MNRLFLKIISLILSVGLWVYVSLGVNPEINRSFSVQVTPQGLSELRTLKIFPEKLTVKLTGKRINFIKMGPDDLKIYLDATKLPDQPIRHEKVPVNLIFPEGFEKKDPFTERVSVEVSLLHRKDFFLGTQPVGFPKEGFLLDKIQPKGVDYISVLGPKTGLNRIEKVFATVDIMGKSEDFTSSFTLELYDKNEKSLPLKELGVKLTPPIIEATITFKKGFPIRELPLKTQFSGQLPSGFKLIAPMEIRTEGDDPVTRLSIQGPRKKIENLQFIQMETIDFLKVITAYEASNTLNNTNHLPKDLDFDILPELPEEVTLTTQLKLKARVKISEEVYDRWVQNIAVVCEGQDLENFHYKVQPSLVDIQVVGRPSEVEALIAAKEPIRLPVENLPPRIHPYNFRLWYPTTLVRIRKIVPPQAQVFIQPLTDLEKAAKTGTPIGTSSQTFESNGNPSIPKNGVTPSPSDTPSGSGTKNLIGSPTLEIRENREKIKEGEGGK